MRLRGELLQRQPAIPLARSTRLDRHHLRKRYLQKLAVPQHLSTHRHRPTQPFRCLSGPVFLDEVEGHTDEDDGADDEEAGGVTGENG